MIYKLSELGDVVGGGTPSTKESNYYCDKGIPWITPRDLSGYDDMYISNGSRYITELGYKSSSAKKLPKGTILFTSRAPIGYVAIAKNIVTTNQGFKSIVPNENIVIPEYLYFIIKKSVNKLINISSGSTFSEISGKVMKNFKVNIPSIEDQKKFLSIMMPLNKKISLNNKINDNLLSIASALYDKKIYNKNYKFINVKNYIMPKRGINITKKNVVKGDVPVVAGGLSPSTYHNKANTNGPVITISSSGANAGYVRLWEKDVWSSDSLYIDNKMTSNIYFWYLTLKKNQKNIFDSQTGSAQPHIYPKHIGNLIIRELNEYHIYNFNQKITPIFKKIGHNSNEIDFLNKLKDGLINKLL